MRLDDSEYIVTSHRHSLIPLRPGPLVVRTVIELLRTQAAGSRDFLFDESCDGRALPARPRCWVGRVEY